MIAAILLSTVVGIAFGAGVQMEPSINLFSSPNWIKETAPVSNLDFVYPVFSLMHDHDSIVRFEQELTAISSPTSAKYGNWFSSEQIVHSIAPDNSKVATVIRFLGKYHIPRSDIHVSKFRDVIRAKVPAQVAENMFSTAFYRYRSVSQRDVTILRIGTPYFLPAEVADVVSVVDDIMRFPAISNPLLSYNAEAKAEGKFTNFEDEFYSCGTKCDGYTTPAALMKAYKFAPPTQIADGNGICVAEFQKRYAHTEHMKEFGESCSSGYEITHTLGEGDKLPCHAGTCAEALMDIEYTAALSNPIPLTVYYVDEYSLFQWIDSVISMRKPPLTHSVSFTLDSANQISPEYMRAANIQFMKAGALGLSLLFASGNNGVWGTSEAATLGNGRHKRALNYMFRSEFPASSPYVTSVGGTDWQTKSLAKSESAWSCSGGGFSELFPTPSWQTEAVSGYLKEAYSHGMLPPPVMFNQQGRGYPDVAAIGGFTNPYCVLADHDTYVGVSGTSASCSVVASIVAQLNNVRLSADKSPLGFMNPFLYENAHCFNDINDHSTNHCVRDTQGTQGFAALDGWDPATGLGSPNFECLKEAALKY